MYVLNSQWWEGQPISFPTAIRATFDDVFGIDIEEERCYGSSRCPNVAWIGVKMGQ